MKQLLVALFLLSGAAIAQDARQAEPKPDPVAAKAEDDRKALEDRVRASAASAAAGGTRAPRERERGVAAGAGPDPRSPKKAEKPDQPAR
jgi:hypothetical protein